MSITLDTESAYPLISQLRSIEVIFVKRLFKGELNSEDISNSDEYDMLFKLRHDYCHWCICYSRGLPFGEKPLHQFPELKDAHQHKNWNYVKNQTPDIVAINGRKITMIEITVTNSRLAKREKITKYSLLIDVLRGSGYEVDLEVIIISMFSSASITQNLMIEHKLPIDVVDQMYDVVYKINKVIHAVESTPHGQEWRIRRQNDVFYDVDMKISIEDIREYHRTSLNKCFYDEDHLEYMLDTKNDHSELTTDEDKFIDHIVDKALDLKSKLTEQQDFLKAKNKLLNFHAKHSNTNEFRPIFPLPYLEGEIIDSADRDTHPDLSEFDSFRGKMFGCKDPVLHKVSQMTDLIGTVKFTESERANIALQGPGRKHYVLRGSEPHIRRQKKNKNIWHSLFDSKSHNYIQETSHKLSVIKNFDLENPDEIQGVGLDYIRCCQSIFRELTLNAMRRDRRHNIIFKPTGVKGVYLIIYPGAKLRTGENLSTIWFKVVSSIGTIHNADLRTNQCFKPWNYDGEIMHSNWISIDANRLDHYIRCFDKILMAYTSYCHYYPGHLNQSINLDTSNTLGIIMMIYMEDKRSTSKMLQDVRYLVMGSLSKFRWWDELLTKYCEPLRSSLQAYMLHKIIVYSEYIHSNISLVIKEFSFGKVYQDSDIISDRLAGVTSKLPRILTTGDPINFQQMLCEMYFTMLFNKNQDDPTHSTFQILNKMLEGEESLREVKETTRLHLGGTNPIEDANILIDNPHKNQFSGYAIMIGSKLQSKEECNKSPAGLSHRLAAQNQFLNKPLSEFATYKSSAIFVTPILSQDKLKSNDSGYQRPINKDHLEEKFREGGEDDEDPISHRLVRQNPRCRCIEAVIKILQEGKYLRSFDLIQSTIMNEMYFQVFKKNQIGGAREILILPIEKRITINILESFTRLICKDDDREMLTHGDVKLSVMRDMVRDMKRTDGLSRLILNYNFDKTRWGPSFMPIQFLYMFKPFCHHYPSLYRFIMLTLMVHSNKKCLIPEKLIHVWLKDIDNEIYHSNPENPEEKSLLQKLKESFLETKKLYFENESNMGQGILHYTSSYLHLCMISLRNEVYKRMCKKLNITPGSWRDIVSSDDSYTAQSLPMDTPNMMKLRIELFIRAQETCERLFNMWTSRSKSSISFLISEFNSMFGSNLTLFPTLLKFALASVHPVNTDSFFRMVKESYNTSRQIVENGGSLELYLFANRLNKKFCESIYHTNIGGFNDFTKLGLNREYVPYQLGVYPIMNPGLMLLLGPECHNYNIINNIDNLTPIELNLLTSCHTLIGISNPELYAELNNFDNIFTGLLRIEAAMGPVKKLQRIKRTIDMSWDDMNKLINDDLLITLRPPQTLSEMKLHTYLKLFSFGSAEALRDTASSIYYARVGASVSAHAYQIPYDDKFSAHYDKKEKRMIGFTYQECLQHLMNRENEFVDFLQFYPHMSEFRTLLNLSKSTSQYLPRHRFETQNIRQLQLSEVTMRIKNPIRDLIEAFWIKNEEDKPTSYFRDWLSLKELVPILHDSLPATLDQIKGDPTTRVKILILILMRVMGYSSKPMKAVVYGPSSRSYDHTFLTLIQQNLYHNFTSDTIIVSNEYSRDPRIYDKISLYYNHYFLSLFYGYPKLTDYENLNHEIIESYCRDNMISSSSKKKIMIMLMDLGFLDDIKAWTEKSKTILHNWVVRQHHDSSGKYVGNFHVVVQCGVNKMSLKRIWSQYKITMTTTDNPIINYELLERLCELVQMTIEDIKPKIRRGGFIISSNRIIHTTTNEGIQIDLQPIEDIHYHVGSATISMSNDEKYLLLEDKDGYQIMKTPIGLLTTESQDVEDLPDILVNGIKFSDLCKYRFFSIDFSYDKLSRTQIIDMLENLNVDRPKISQITKQRLSDIVSPEWQTQDTTDVLNEEDEYTDEKLLKFEEDLLLTEPDIKIVSSLQTDEYDFLLDTNIDSGLITNLPVVRMVHQPRRILDRIINSKYHLITRCCVDPTQICSKTIKTVWKMRQDPRLIYSLVYVYDKMFTSLEPPSPPFIQVTFPEEFIHKFFDLDDEVLNIS